MAANFNDDNAVDEVIRKLEEKDRTSDERSEMDKSSRMTMDEELSSSYRYTRSELDDMEREKKEWEARRDSDEGYLYKGCYSPDLCTIKDPRETLDGVAVSFMQFARNLDVPVNQEILRYFRMSGYKLWQLVKGPKLNSNMCWALLLRQLFFVYFHHEEEQTPTIKISLLVSTILDRMGPNYYIWFSLTHEITAEEYDNMFSRSYLEYRECNRLIALQLTSISSCAPNVRRRIVNSDPKKSDKKFEEAANLIKLNKPEETILHAIEETPILPGWIENVKNSRRQKQVGSDRKGKDKEAVKEVENVESEEMDGIFEFGRDRNSGKREFKSWKSMHQ